MVLGHWNKEFAPYPNKIPGGEVHEEKPKGGEGGKLKSPPGGEIYGGGGEER